MKATKKIYSYHEMNANEFCNLCDTENLLLQLSKQYNEDDVLMTPNTGEVIFARDILKAASLLGFLTECRVVEVNPK